MTAGTCRKQAQRVEAALIDGAGGPGQLRRPADLALDLLEELFELRGRGFRLLALDAHQGGLDAP